MPTFHSDHSSLREEKSPFWGALGISQQLSVVVLWKQQQAITPALKNDGEIRHNDKHRSQRGLGDLCTQKTSEAGLEGHNTAVCSVNTHTAF